ncbi:MAG: aminopeptidase P family protein [Dysgonamonadaceae bacterium]|jgi:Xaa-Pro aminopeptidase|nr:aminopeptidase P family protein [Dysgonamonadaceae bacterium]
MKNIKQRIEFLKKQMQTEEIAAVIIPSSDPHLNEYLPEHWKTREYFSGFTGSAGTLVITSKEAGLWTDSRYFLQAETELKGSGIKLFKSGTDGVPEYACKLMSELEENSIVGIEGAVFPVEDVVSLQEKFSKKNIMLKTDVDFHNKLWTDRPAIPQNPVFLIEERFSGKACSRKIQELLEALEKYHNAEMMIITALDEIAWLFNMRGEDVEYNPVSIAFAIVSTQKSILFIDESKMTDENVRNHILKEGVTIAGYDTIYEHISSIPGGTRLLIPVSKTNFELYSRIPEGCRKIEVEVSPVAQMKSIKNEVEIKGFRNAMQRDGVAMVKFLAWLETSLAAGKAITELDVAAKLKSLRSEQDLYLGESFATIAGYAAHSAIVHYRADEKSNSIIMPKGILLVDSGAHYLDGTTDLTRTVACGEISGEMKRDFTLVLKGHIALSTICFPKGTTGTQIDAIARQFLWKDGANYLHGTGHGVGHCLPVHEGPQKISTLYNPIPLQAGMIISNEPGIYREGKYGIRIENLLMVTPYKSTGFGEFYTFETLTLCPIDTRLIEFSLLTEAETKWLKDYHRKVYESLSPSLTEDLKAWLERCTA